MNKNASPLAGSRPETECSGYRFGKTCFDTGFRPMFEYCEPLQGEVRDKSGYCSNCNDSGGNPFGDLLLNSFVPPVGHEGAFLPFYAYPKYRYCYDYNCRYRLYDLRDVNVEHHGSFLSLILSRHFATLLLLPFSVLGRRSRFPRVFQGIDLVCDLLFPWFMFLSGMILSFGLVLNQLSKSGVVV